VAGNAIADVLAHPGAAELLARLGAEAVAAEAITTLHLQGSQCFAYRVTLADGRRVKLRRPSRPERAARAWQLLESIADARFAMVILREGDLVVEEWVDGTPVGESPRPEHVASAAAFLAALHRVRIDGIDTGQVMSTTAMRDATCSRLEGLRQYALLAGDKETRLSTAVRSLAPTTAATGITHNDLCGENLVVDVSGKLRIVDYDDVAPGFVDLDLARTWYRWELEPTSWEHFLAQYVAEGGTRPAASAFEFWKIAAVTKSAVVRLAASPEQREHALARLRALAG
jgi:hypothetical protein